MRRQVTHIIVDHPVRSVALRRFTADEPILPSLPDEFAEIEDFAVASLVWDIVTGEFFVRNLFTAPAMREDVIRRNLLLEEFLELQGVDFQ